MKNIVRRLSCESMAFASFVCPPTTRSWTLLVRYFWTWSLGHPRQDILHLMMLLTISINSMDIFGTSSGHPWYIFRTSSGYLSFPFIHNHFHSFTIIYIHSQSFPFINNHLHSFTTIYIHSQLYTFIHNHLHSFTIIYIH